MDNARKYNINIGNTMSCGLGTYTKNVIKCNLLNSFSITCDTNPQTVKTYSVLSVNELSDLSKIEYENRVRDFLDYINVQSNILKESLFNEASFCVIEPYCYLNSNFLVYKFLSGIRIVNAGIASGVLQYKVYPSSDNPDNYVWQTNPTYLNLDQNGIYVVEIRDYVNSIENCKYSKTISMSLLLQSTTTTLTPKTIKLATTNNCDAYSAGYIQITPSLSLGEKISVGFIANALVSGSGTACVKFYRETYNSNCCNINNDYCFITNTNSVSPKLGNLMICYGDIIRYSLVVNPTSCGSNSNANFCINSLNGLGTVSPIIDITCCSVTKFKCIPAIDLTISLDKSNNFNSSLNTCIISGSFNISKEIPAGQCATIKLATTNRVSGGSSTIIFSCIPHGVCCSQIPICTINNNNCQPQYPEIIARNCDKLYYCMLLSAPSNGSGACGIIKINNLWGSIGVNPTTIPELSGNCISGSISIASLPVIYSICTQNSCNSWENGNVIGTTANIGTNQCAAISYIINQKSVWCGISSVKLYCKPNGGSCSVPLQTLETIANVGETKNNSYCGSFIIRHGDRITYNVCTNGMNGSCSDFRIINVIGTMGIIPSICNTKNRACRSITVAPISTTVAINASSTCTGIESGIISITPSMGNIASSINMCYNINQKTVCSGVSLFRIYCKPNGNSCTYTKYEYKTTTCLNGNTYSGCVNIKYGDVLSYYNCTNGGTGSCSDMCITQLTSSPNIIPIKSVTNYRTCVKK